jgi:antitoxin HigA-1
MEKPAKRLDPIPPGEILLEEFVRPHGISQNRLARDIDINPARVNDIVHGRSSITAAIALRLAKYFGTTPGVAGARTQGLADGHLLPDR